MALVAITVYETASEVALGDPIQFTSATIDGANSAAISGTGKKRRRCRLYAETDVWVKWGESPTVTGASDGLALGADNPEYFDIESGHVITAITRA